MMKCNCTSTQLACYSDLSSANDITIQCSMPSVFELRDDTTSKLPIQVIAEIDNTAGKCDDEVIDVTDDYSTWIKYSNLKLDPITLQNKLESKILSYNMFVVQKISMGVIDIQENQFITCHHIIWPLFYWKNNRVQWWSHFQGAC